MTENICEIVYSCLKEIHSNQKIREPVYTGTLRQHIIKNYKEIPREELTECLRKLESMERIKCYYDQDGTLYRSYII